jgi:hypothetical protein
MLRSGRLDGCKTCGQDAWMRSFATAALLLAALPALMVAGGMGLSGCKKKENPAPSAEKPTGDPKVGANGDGRTKQALGRAPVARQPFTFEPVTVDEVKPYIPQLTGVAPIGEPKVIAGGRRVMALGCGSGTDLAAMKAELEKKLGELGFSAISTPRVSSRLNAVTFMAQKGDLRVSAAVRSTKDADCPADQKKNKLFMTYFKLPNHARPAAAPVPGGAAPVPAPSAPPPGAPPPGENAPPKSPG